MILNNLKCHVCETKKDHKFSQCLSSDCQCQCVKEIYTMSPNAQEDKITQEHPLFLNVSPPEVIKLRNRDGEIAKFNKIDKTRWIDETKEDKRKKKSNGLDYWGDKI